MAIISGMESVELDDVKPFELPVEDMAKGILARQQRADKAKEMAAMGASSLAFPVRNLEEDYSLRKQIMDEFQTDTQKLVDNAGGDWSNVENSQLQQVGIKYAMDKRTGALLEAKSEEDRAKEMLRRIQENNGAPLRFGNDPFTQSIYEKDGKLRTLTDWSIEKKLDHEKRADDYFDHIGTSAVDEVVWKHSSSFLDAAAREKLYYDIWNMTWEQVKTNVPQLNSVFENQAGHFKRDFGGEQYYRQLIQEAITNGKTELEAKQYADDAIHNLLWSNAQKRILLERQKKSQQDYNPFPRDPVSNTPSPRGPKGTGDGDDDKKKTPVGFQSEIERTDEGLRIKGLTLRDESQAILSNTAQLDPTNINFNTATNIHQIGRGSVLVPSRIGSSGTGLSSNEGNIYQITQDGFSTNRRFGHNPIAARVINSPTGLSHNFGFKSGAAITGNLDGMWETAIKAFETGDEYGKGILEDNDIYKYYYDSFIAKKYSPKEAAAAATQEVIKFKGGTDEDLSMGALAGLLDYDIVDGVPVYKEKGFDGTEGSSVLDYALSKTEKRIKELESKGSKTKDEESELRLLTAKKKNIQEKKVELKITTDIFNMDPFTFMANYDEDVVTQNETAIKKAEAMRTKSKMLYTRAKELEVLDWQIARDSGFTREEYELLTTTRTNLSNSEKVAKKKLETDYEKSKLQYTKALAASIGSGLNLDSVWRFNMDSRLTHLEEMSKNSPRAKENLQTAENLVTGMKKLLEGKFDSSKMREFTSLHGGKKYKGQFMATFGTGGFDNSDYVSDFTAYLLIESGVKFIQDPKNPDYYYLDLTRSNDGSWYGLEKDAKTGFVHSVGAATLAELTDDVDAFYANVESGISNPDMRASYLRKVEEKLPEVMTTYNRGLDPKWTVYHQKYDEIKTEYLSEGLLFKFPDMSSTGGKEFVSEVLSPAKQQLSLAISGGETDMNLIKRVTWGGKKANGTRETELPEDINKQTFLAEALEFIRSKDSEKTTSLSEFMIDKMDKYFLGVMPDINNDGSKTTGFNYVWEVPTKEGIPLKIEIAMPTNQIDLPMLNALGIDASTVMYMDEAAKTYEESGNTYIELTVPQTKNSAKPIKKKYYKAHADMKLNPVNGTALTIGKGQWFSFEGSDAVGNLYDQIKAYEKGITGARVESYGNEVLVFNSFHNNYAKEDAALRLVMMEIDKDKSGVLAAAGKYGSQSTKFKTWFLERYDENTYNRLTKNGTQPITEASYNNLKLEISQKHGKTYAEANRKELGTFGGGSIKLTTPSETGTYGYNLTVNGNKATKDQLKKVPTEHLVEVLESDKLKGNTKLKQLAETLKAGDVTNKPDATLGYRMENGERYIVDTRRSGITLSASDGTMANADLNSSKDGSYRMNITKGGTEVRAHAGVPARLRKEVYEAFSNCPYKGNSFFITSSQRSIESNMGTYANNFYGVTDSEHLYSNAIDISTARYDSGISNNAPQFDGNGYEYLSWLYSSDGKAWLKANNLWVYHHDITGTYGGYHIHIDYNPKNAGVIKWHDDATNGVDARKKEAAFKTKYNIK